MADARQIRVTKKQGAKEPWPMDSVDIVSIEPGRNVEVVVEVQDLTVQIQVEGFFGDPQPGCPRVRIVIPGWSRLKGTHAREHTRTTEQG